MSQHRSGYGSLGAHPALDPVSITATEMDSSIDMGSKETPEKLSKEKLLKEEVNLHFENHWQKWKRRKYRVCKVGFHILLIILVTTQASETIRT